MNFPGRLRRCSLGLAVGLLSAGLAGCGVQITRQYPSFDTYRPEVEGERIVLDPYRPPSIQRWEAANRFLNGVPLTIEVNQPDQWREMTTAQLLSGDSTPLPVRAVVLGRARVRDPSRVVARYLFPKVEISDWSRYDHTWDDRAFVPGTPPYAGVSEFSAANPGWEFASVPVAGVESVAVGGKAIKPPREHRVVQDGIENGREPLAGGWVVQGSYLAQSDSFKVLGRWFTLRNPSDWVVRLGTTRARIDGLRAGEVSDYSFLAQGDWAVATDSSDMYLEQLANAGETRAPVLFVCEHRRISNIAGGSGPACLNDGHRYLLRFGGDHPVLIPVRVERRGKITSLGVGVGLVLVFLGWSAG